MCAEIMTSSKKILSDPCQMYFTFRAFYLQFCSKLHEVSSDRQGILSLCALFENLVSYNQELCLISD